ncbi:MAG: hypothetical protein EPO65_00645 [Dehalococcoidia bacterium]|nr:MAG: hypothetical protein EPO65_00645 [Dehalococcoidia bacterium]
MAVDLGEVLSAATAYGDAREAEGRAAEREAVASELAALHTSLEESEAARAELGGQLAALRAEYDAHMATHEPTPTPTRKVIGMSAPAAEWATRLAEVGPTGVTARRIFCDLAKGADHRRPETEQAIDAGMMPVLSFKVGGNITGAVAGSYDGVAEQVAARLQAYDVPVAVTFWHEPNPDITGAQFCNLHRRLLPIFRAERVFVGPLWNGWLLDNQVSTFAAYSAPDLLEAWDFAGMDIYAQGNKGQPSTWKLGPARGLPKLVAWLEAQGHADKPILIGEYNGWTAEHIAQMGEAVLSEPQVWAALLFNSDNGDKGLVLTGDRLEAFRVTKADPRAQQ